MGGLDMRLCDKTRGAASMNRIGCAAALLAMFAVSTPAEAAEACSSLQAAAAERAVAAAQTWTEMHRAYAVLSACDDGWIGEGISESVARIVLGKRPQLHLLQQFGETDPGFYALVVKHVDSSLTAEQLAGIKQVAEQACPGMSKRVCAALVKNANAALADLRKVVGR